MSGRTYRSWRIAVDPFCGWVATSPDYAGTWEGPEDGYSREGDMVWGKTLPEIHAEIDAAMGPDE